MFGHQLLRCLNLLCSWRDMQRVRKDEELLNPGSFSVMKQSCHGISRIPSQRAYVYQLQLPQLLQLLQFCQPTMTTMLTTCEDSACTRLYNGHNTASWVPCMTLQEWKDTHGRLKWEDTHRSSSASVKFGNVHTTRPHLPMAPLSSSSQPKLIQEPFMDEPGNASQKTNFETTACHVPFYDVFSFISVTWSISI